MSSREPSLATGLREAAAAVDALEAADIRVSEVDPVARTEACDVDYMTVSLVVGVPLQESTGDQDTEGKPADDQPAGDEDDASIGPRWCGICGDGPYERPASHHANRNDHAGEPVLLDHEPTDDEIRGVETETTDEPDEVWCGRCGAGPYDRVSTHHTMRDDHAGDPVALDHQPTDDELVPGDAPVDDPAEADRDVVDGGEPAASATTQPDQDERAADGGAIEFSDFKNQSGDLATDPLNYKRVIELREEIAEALDLDWDAGRTDSPSTSFLTDHLAEIVVEITDWRYDDFEDEPERRQCFELIARAIDAEPESSNLSKRSLKPLHREIVGSGPGGRVR